MNNFFKTFFACLLAIFVSGIFMIILGFIMLAGIFAVFGTQERAVLMRPNTVLRIDLSIPFVERHSNNPLERFDYTDFTFREQVTLLETVTMIGKAANDPQIDGIYLQIPMAIPSSLSTLYEVREALKEFKQSGKFIIAYGDVYSQGGYYLASVADRIYLNPQGGMDWSGFASNVLFYKGLFDKLGIQAELIRHGEFKSAGEPFVQEKMSPENRTQIESMVRSMWDGVVGQIGEARRLSVDSLQAYADNLSVTLPRQALEARMVDGLMYRDELREELKKLTGTEKLRVVGLDEYKRSGNVTIGNILSGNKIALVYADGDIVDGGDKNKQIVGNALAAELAKVREDKNVKALVFRVNSPGGSALASEVIWREIELISRQIPVVVSMGNYAASGGYYISCAADEIVVTPATLTGSIGVFSLFFNLEQGMKNKLGITSETIRTNRSADLGNPFRAMTPAERIFMQNQVDSVYARFSSLVAQGRDMSLENVDQLAGGRVWTGAQARENGLADRIGTLTDAIQVAVQRAGLDGNDFYLRTYPEQGSNSFFTILESLTGEVRHRIRARGQNMVTDELNYINELLNNEGIRAEIPYRLETIY